MIEYDGFKHNYYCNNTKELVDYLTNSKYGNQHFLDGDCNATYIIFLSSDWARYTNDIENKEFLHYENAKFYINDNEKSKPTLKELFDKISVLMKPKKTLDQLYKELDLILKRHKLENKNLVYINEAVIYYLNGQKTKRFINKEILDITNEIALLEKKRQVFSHVWDDIWVYNDKGKKIYNDKTEKFEEENFVLSPIQVFEKEGFNKYKLWQIDKVLD